MKTKLLFILFIGIFSNAMSQHYSGLKNIKLEKTEDFIKNETKVLKCANFILKGPTSENELSKMYSIQFIMRWMEGTEYVFTLEGDFLKYTKNSKDLTAIYLAALAKAALDSQDRSIKSDEITKKANTIFLDYCAEPKNKVKYNKAVKKELKARG